VGVAYNVRRGPRHGVWVFVPGTGGEPRQLRDSIKFNFGHMTSLFIKRPGWKASKGQTALPTSTLTCGRNRNLVPYIQITCVTRSRSRSRSQSQEPVSKGPKTENHIRTISLKMSHMCGTLFGHFIC